MSYRFSLSNPIRFISREQFQTLVTDFASFCAGSFGCECNIEVRAMTALKVFTTHMPDRYVLEYMHDLNEKNTFFKTDDPLLVTAEIFESAVFIEVFVRSKDKTLAPQSAFGAIDFKGRLRRRATFYVQPGAPALAEKLKAKNRFMILGDGYGYHCDPG